MPRAARVVIPGSPHHLTQRGNNRQDVFFVDDDRRAFLRLLAEAGARFGLAVEGYCLMTNHFHLLAVPREKESMHLALKWASQLYTQYVNRLHGRSGHLWQDRFFSCPLDRAHGGTALAYVERNPVRAGVVRRAWQWPWSSAAAHCGEADASGLVRLQGWRQAPEHWRGVLRAGQDEGTLRELRLCTSRGRPLGSDSFISKLEGALGRRLRPLPPGRPRKARGSGQ